MGDAVGESRSRRVSWQLPSFHRFWASFDAAPKNIRCPLAQPESGLAGPDCGTNGPAPADPKTRARPVDERKPGPGARRRRVSGISECHVSQEINGGGGEGEDIVAVRRGYWVASTQSLPSPAGSESTARSCRSPRVAERHRFLAAAVLRLSILISRRQRVERQTSPARRIGARLGAPSVILVIQANEDGGWGEAAPPVLLAVPPPPPSAPSELAPAAP